MLPQLMARGWPFPNMLMPFLFGERKHSPPAVQVKRAGCWLIHRSRLMIAVLMPYYLTQHVRVALGTKVATYFLEKMCRGNI